MVVPLATTLVGKVVMRIGCGLVVPLGDACASLSLICWRVEKSVAPYSQIYSFTISRRWEALPGRWGSTPHRRELVARPQKERDLLRR